MSISFCFCRKIIVLSSMYTTLKLRFSNPILPSYFWRFEFLAVILIYKSIAFQQGIEHEIPLGIFGFTSIFSFHINVENRPKFGGSKILVPKIKFWNINHVIAVVLLWAEFERTESFWAEWWIFAVWAEYSKGPNAVWAKNGRNCK
jgi:hypothetical protein